MPATVIRRRNSSPLREKIARRLTSYRRRIRRALRRADGRALPVFVMGYGRSGTTMLMNSFALDERFEIFREHDARIAKDAMLVYENVGREIAACRMEALVLKPILNSFEASKILDKYDRAKIIWMTRDYRDVSASAVNRFGSAVAEYLKDRVLTGRGDNWLAHGIPEETVELLRTTGSSGFSDHDWTALVWWSVNRTLLVDGLCENSRFLLLRYEDLVRNPEPVLENVYGFLGLEYGRALGRYIHRKSVGKGSTVDLHPTVRQKCEELTEQIAESCARAGGVPGMPPA